VGETVAARPLVERLLALEPAPSVLLTTTTPTGAETVARLFGARVRHHYLPWDLPGAVGRFLDRQSPGLFIVMETELWPNLLAACAQRGIPAVLANGRLSERSARGYGRVPGLSRPMLESLALLAVQGEADAARFRALGAPPGRVRVTGNLKFEGALAPEAAAGALRAAWGPARPVWIAASTHPGEEGQILAAHATLRRALPTALLVLVPRHPERAAECLRLPALAGLPVARRSTGEACGADTAVYLVDTLGELTAFYGAVDCAFVGGSLVRHGGHNCLEPAAVGLPVLVGPHCFNFAAITEGLAAAGGVLVVADAEALATELGRLLQDPAACRAMGARARGFLDAHRGGLDTLWAALLPLLPGDGRAGGGDQGAAPPQCP
jgi:3-deoxy-D-manno-octulosonic-acid transferase